MPRRKFPRPRRESKSTMKAKPQISSLCLYLKWAGNWKSFQCFFFRLFKIQMEEEKDCSSSLLFLSTSALSRAVQAVHFSAQPRYGESIDLSTVFPLQTLLHCCCSMLARQSVIVPAVQVFSQPGFSCKKPDTLQLQPLPFCFHVEKKGPCWSLWSHWCVCLHFSV